MDFRYFCSKTRLYKTLIVINVFLYLKLKIILKFNLKCEYIKDGLFQCIISA